jgi:hypothetical protein
VTVSAARRQLRSLIDLELPGTPVQNRDDVPTEFHLQMQRILLGVW